MHRLKKLFITGFLKNEAETGADLDLHPDLLPRRWPARSPEQVFEAARQAVEAEERWSIAEADDARRHLHVECRTSSGLFTDDLNLWIEPAPQGTGAVVRAHSRSRIGTGDWGQNARWIRRLFELLDRRLGPGQPFPPEQGA